MSHRHFVELLTRVQRGVCSVEQAASHLEKHSFLDLGGVTVDVGRRARTGTPEVVFSEGKSREQLEAIARSHRQLDEPVLFTRVRTVQVGYLADVLPEGNHNACARTFVWKGSAAAGTPAETDDLVVVSAGASDAPVAEEVAETYQFVAGCRPRLHQDCGVAGLHRLLARLDALERARVVVAVAGMDGVLPTVVAGLVHAPVIAVPTSVGYGPGAGGLTPLLTMLASCAPGLVVVNVDNGVGAACAAARILGRGRCVAETVEPAESR